MGRWNGDYDGSCFSCLYLASIIDRMMGGAGSLMDSLNRSWILIFSAFIYMDKNYCNHCNSFFFRFEIMHFMQYMYCTLTIPTDASISLLSLFHLCQDLVETMIETRKKSMDYCQFPGFRHGELIELPGQLESPPILHRVTKAQNFNVCI